MGSWPARDWYDEARAYDIVFDAGTEVEADFIEAAFDRHATGAARRHGTGPHRAALEPACGTGRLLRAMARRGWSMTGYDCSRPALAYARRRLAELEPAGTATVHVGAMQDWRRRRPVDLAFNLVSTFKYLLDEDDARSHLASTAAMLRPGGLYVLGLHLTDYQERGRQRERWVERRDDVTVTAVIETGPPNRTRRTEAMRARLTVAPGPAAAAAEGDELKFETTWTFRTYGPRQLRSLLATVPELELVAVHDFTYRIDEPIPFGGDQLDHVLILRRRD